MERADLAAKTRDYITDYIKFADSKAGAVLGLCLAISGLLAALSDKLVAQLDGGHPLLVLTVACLGILLVYAAVMIVWHCVSALAPRTTSKHKSALSFPEIASDPHGYLARVGTLDASGCASELEKHAADIATIAAAKFADIASAVWWLRLQIFGAYGLVILHVVAKVTQMGK